MEPGETRKRNYLNLIIGAAFVAYGSYRLINFWKGEEISTFRVVIAVAFVILGAYDLYKFFFTLKNKG